MPAQTFWASYFNVYYFSTIYCSKSLQLVYSISTIVPLFASLTEQTEATYHDDHILHKTLLDVTLDVVAISIEADSQIIDFKQN